tara:strand:- start:2554 stop:2925 length:372 start_codon:yes stop_codon:yes gene_type:complete
MSLGIEELIISKNNNDTLCGGFKINNMLLNSNNPAFVTLNNNNTEINDKVSSLFKDLAVPIGLLYINEKMKPSNKDIKKGLIEDSLYDKLLKLAEKKSKTQTRKNIKLNKKNGKKQRTSKIKM